MRNKPRPKTVAIVMFATFLSLPMAVPTWAQDYDEVIHKHRAIAQRLMAESHFVGYSVAASINGEILWDEGFGLADIENKVAVSAETKFRVASVSKTLTSAAIGQLYEQGKLDMDAPIQQYVPSFPEKPYSISLRQLAGHLAGIRHYKGNEMYSTQHYPDVQSGLGIFKDDPLLFEPGTQYSYSSYGWNLISAAIETASQVPFLAYMQTHVFEKANMHDTLPELAGPIVLHRARFYEVSDDGSVTNAPYVDNSYKWAGGGFLSTAADLVRFGNATLHGVLVEPATFEWLITSQSTRDGERTEYGIGWSTDMAAVAIRGLREYDEGLADDAENKLRGATVVGHTGGAIGGTALFLVAPEENIVVAALSNCSLRPSFAIHLLADLVASQR